MDKEIYYNAPILEFDEDDALQSKQYFFANHKKPFEQFDKAKKLGITKAIIFFPRSFEELSDITKDCELIYEFKAASSISPIYIYNNEFLIAQCPLGGPGATNLMEELSYVGINTFLACGSCGCLRDDIDSSLFFIPTSAIRDEGLSYHYLKASRTVDTNKSLNRTLENTLNQYGMKYIKGKVWTTDAMYRETPNRIARRVEEGALGVDMECASLAACAKYNNLTFSSLFYFTDLIGSNKWQWRLYDKKILRTNLVKLCVAALRK